MRLHEKLRRIAAPAAVRVAKPAVAVALPGAHTDSVLGKVWVRRVALPLTHRHGRFTLAEIAAQSLAPLAEIARDPNLLQFDWKRAIFFDTETTSLGGGVGTYVFLLGAAYFEKDAFVVEQFFLDDVTEERALLHMINERFARFDVAVSFHGKHFDAPRLTGRLVFHRMKLALPASHLDLCVVGRSLYRGAFENCRLQTFEKEIVGFERQDDLPGADCPRAFFDHLQGDSTLIPRVFEHNLYDVLTMPAVAHRFAQSVAEPDHPVVRANLGSFYESVGRQREARENYEEALLGLRTTNHAHLPRALERLALLERRAGRHAVSAQLLLERCAIHPHALQPLEDLAKYYEHRARDLSMALATTMDARSRLLTGKIEVDRHTRARHLAALDHRRQRLERRDDA